MLMMILTSTNPGVDENQQSVITLAATDEDGDTLTIDGGTDAVYLQLILQQES